MKLSQRFEKSEWSFLAWTAALIVMPLLMGSEYNQHLCVNALIWLLSVQGLNIFLGYCGNMSLGQAGFYAIGGYVFTLLVMKAGMGWWVSLLLSILGTTLIGFILGAIGIRCRGSAFIIISILFARIVNLVLLNWISLTNGQAGITNIPTPVLFGEALTSKIGWYYFVLVFVVIMQFLTKRLIDSKIGRAFIAVKQDESLATSLGISPYFFSLAAFTISMVTTSLAGALHASYVGLVSPELANFNNVMLFIIMMVVIGGRGTLWGPVIGAFIFTFLPEYLRVAEALRLPIFGLMLVLLVLFLPDGLLPTIKKLYRKYQHKQAEKKAKEVA